MNGIIKNALILTGLALIVGLGYYLYTQNILFSASNDTDGLPGVSAVQSEQSLRRLKELEDITIKNNIFSDARFTSLRSFSAEIVQLPTGKSNPFQSVN